jgi:hypothetical protein
MNGQFEHQLTTILADALAKTRHLGGMNRQAVFKMLLAAEVLPIRIFEPAGDNELVG